MKKQTLSVILLMAILALSLFAVQNAHAPATNLATLVADRIGEPQDLDPAWAHDSISAELLMNVYDTLLWFNRTGMDTYIARLATEWEYDVISEFSPEGMIWIGRFTFRIREYVYFHSDGVNDIPGEGTLLTPADVEYTFERLLITDAATGPGWMLWNPLLGNYSAFDLNRTLTDVGWSVNPATGWNTRMDEAIGNAVQSNSTSVWFNLVMSGPVGVYEPFLQILCQSLSGIVSRAWCVWHGDWPGPYVGDNWYLWHDPATSPLYSSNPASPGPHLDCALGTGPYMLDYWNRGVGNAWSIIKNPNYWEGWSTPYQHLDWGYVGWILGHVDRYQSNYIPAWPTRRLRFLSGVSDFCDVPRQYYAEVDGQPGVICHSSLPQLVADACFFNFRVSAISTHLGITQPDSTFSPFGAPRNIMDDLNFRRAICHIFDYTMYLSNAFKNEAIAPVTPIIPGLAHYDPSIGVAEQPSSSIKKEYGITDEPSGQKAYDTTLAKAYLQVAWGGAVWANGFTMDVCYDQGNLAGKEAADRIKWDLESYNTTDGTKFTINVVSIPWSSYREQQRARVMPLYIASWHADFYSTHNFAHSFWHSEGAMSKFQGYLGTTSFPNPTVDFFVDSAWSTIEPSARQGNYSALQQWYVNNAPGFVVSQPTGRHFERDWVQGWYYNPLAQYNFIYDLWKTLTEPAEEVDVEVTNLDCPTEIRVTNPTVDNTVTIVPSPISVTVTRLDIRSSSLSVIIGVGLQDEGGMDIVLDTATATLPWPEPDSYTAYFASFTQDPTTPIYAGVYKVFATVQVISGNAQDNVPGNNRIEQAPIGINQGDCNLDNTCDMADISLCIEAFMAASSDPHWDVRCDTNRDKSVDMADISTCIDFFMTSYPFP